uniref:Uncharacterized protein n=1 Tax=Podoviridae sp. ctQyH19 TaxID=2825249 RepID=A0A8S5UQS5_9CAUD|nr:MAG TPA: hypothetical protein [Podoviridae sp. ctQyH19]
MISSIIVVFFNWLFVENSSPPKLRKGFTEGKK